MVKIYSKFVEITFIVKLYKDNRTKVYKYIKHSVRKNDYFHFNYLSTHWFFAGIVIVFLFKKNWYIRLYNLFHINLKKNFFFIVKKLWKMNASQYQNFLLVMTRRKSFVNRSMIQDLLFVLIRSKVLVILNIHRHILNN